MANTTTTTTTTTTKAAIKPPYDLGDAVLDGAIVIDTRHHAGDFLILCIRPASGEYISWYVGTHGQLASGHYFRDLSHAVEDFNIRIGD